MKRGLGLTIVMLASLSLVAASTSLAASRKATDNSISVAVGPDPSYAPYIVGLEKGIFAKYGLNVSLKYFSNGGDMNDALVAGQVQFSGAGTGTLLPRLSTKKDAIIAVTATSGTTFAMAARSNLNSPKDFIGKKLGVVPGTTPDFVWKLFLQKNNISPNQVQMVYAPPPELTTSLAQGKIDAMYIWQPWPFKATQLSSDVKIYQHSRDIGYLLYFDASGNVDWMKHHPGLTVALLHGLQDSIAYINSHKAETVSIMANVMHQSVADTTSMVSDYNYKLQMPDKGMIQDAHAEGTWLARLHKLNTRTMPWKYAFATEYLAQVLHVKPVSAVLNPKKATG